MNTLDRAAWDIVAARDRRLQPRGVGIAEELAWMMGRPIPLCGWRDQGAMSSAPTLWPISPNQPLADIENAEKAGFKRFIRRGGRWGFPLPLVAPWNFPI